MTLNFGVKSISCEQAYSISVSPTMASDKFQFDHTSLQWQSWTGSIPNGAVSIYNEEYKRTEYVAKCGLQPGFYSPSLDRYCHYPCGCEERRAGSFEILVNKDNFEFLEWKPDSYGKVPENAVKTLEGHDTYVARGKYGLGKVHASHKVFYYPWNGKEYKSSHYEVLTFRRDTIKEEIVDVKYKTNGVQIMKILRRSSQSQNPAHGAQTLISALVPKEESFGFNEGRTRTESISRSVKVEHEVPPRHSCTVKMEARMFSADIPFTAQLRRTYRNGKTATTTITGTYKGVQVGEVLAVVDPCVPLE
uniref:Uncharacterized protein n=1 Tax=Sphaeramia orbicularis TaxID=375764 RepID=A0A672Z0R7_9TELE